jgi:glutamate carboxypeptidase
MAKFLERLILAESPSRDPHAQEAVFDILRSRFEKLGYQSKRVPGKKTGGYLLSSPITKVKNQPIQLLIGHCDTVWEMGTIAKMPITLHNGKMTGPGVFDMKAGITQMLFALEIIKELELSLSVMPICLINADEEIGSPDSTSIIEHLAKQACRAYILEPPLGLEGKLKTRRKGLARYTLSVKGIAAHAGLDPGKGASAILELSHQIQELFSFNNHEKGTTVNVGMIEGGVSANVVAPACTAVIDVRVATQEEAISIDQKIRNLQPFDSNVSLDINGGFGRPPMQQTERNKALWQSAKQQAELLELEIQQASAGGGSDANTTSQYTATLDGLGTPGDGAHASHEFIFIEKLKERTALLILMLLLPEQ